jgi:prophage regulatory protein
MQTPQQPVRASRARKSEAAPPAQPLSVRAGAAARMLGIGESTLWRWAKEREGFPQPLRIGPKTTVFDSAKLISWRDAQQGGAQG